MRNSDARWRTHLHKFLLDWFQCSNYKRCTGNKCLPTSLVWNWFVIAFLLLANHLASYTNHSYLNPSFRLSVFKYLFFILVNHPFFTHSHQPLYSTLKLILVLLLHCTLCLYTSCTVCNCSTRRIEQLYLVGTVLIHTNRSPIYLYIKLTKMKNLLHRLDKKFCPYLIPEKYWWKNLTTYLFIVLLLVIAQCCVLVHGSRWSMGL